MTESHREVLPQPEDGRMAKLVLMVIVVIGGGPGPYVPILLPATRRCDAPLVARCCTVGGADPSTGSTWSYEWKFCLQLDSERYKYEIIGKGQQAVCIIQLTFLLTGL